MDDIIKKQIPNALDETHFDIGTRKKGKVRDNYWVNDKIVMVATDRISAFDVVLGTIPFKGEMLTELSVWWFDQLKDIVPNHVIQTPDPSVMVVQRCESIPVELVVRGYLTGSLWRAYEKGDRNLYGLNLPAGLKKNQVFKEPVITPTTKAQQGHDLPLTRKEIIAQKLIDEKTYALIEKAALQLFSRGQQIAKNRGMILVDTKYEFGMHQSGIMLIDEVHTPDSSRFWYKDSYDTSFKEGKDPQQMSKEFVREWLMERGFSGEGTPPPLTDDLKVKAALRYKEIVEKFIGKPLNLQVANVQSRIKNNLELAGWKVR